MTKALMLDLLFGPQKAKVAPGIGGSLAAYSIMRKGVPTHLLRPTAPGMAAPSVLDLACFPLVPYASRIRHGHFRFEGREIQLPPNFGDHPHSIHGHGWQRPWTVVTQQRHTVTMDYDHAPDAWPWAYGARQIIALGEAGLSVELSVTNHADTAMPVGLGLHPYFPRARGARLKANVSAVWRMDEEVMPIEPIALPPTLGLPAGVALAGTVLDNGFEGWDGKAYIEWPSLGLGLDVTASPLFSRLVVYAPAGQDFFCVEPVSHMTDAFNRAAAGETDTGMRVLAPGETLSASMRLGPRAL